MLAMDESTCAWNLPAATATALRIRHNGPNERSTTWGRDRSRSPAHVSLEPRYERVLTFVTLTAPPALLYAIPVERFMALQDAQITNFWFLAIVALWRVALRCAWVPRIASHDREHRVLEVQQREREHNQRGRQQRGDHGQKAIQLADAAQKEQPHDDAYAIVVLLAMLSTALAPFLFIIYLIGMGVRYRDRRNRDQRK
jgi:hypothetical protein